MVRKYFDITEAQENALKERAQALGTSEDELTRRAPAPLDRDELYADRSHREQSISLPPLVAPSFVLDTNLLVHCFDAQIWATAKRNRVPAVLSEDFPVGGTVEGVTFVNPLSDAVDLSELQTGVQ